MMGSDRTGTHAPAQMDIACLDLLLTTLVLRAEAVLPRRRTTELFPLTHRRRCSRTPPWARRAIQAFSRALAAAGPDAKSPLQIATSSPACRRWRSRDSSSTRARARPCRRCCHLTRRAGISRADTPSSRRTPPPWSTSATPTRSYYRSSPSGIAGESVLHTGGPSPLVFVFGFVFPSAATARPNMPLRSTHQGHDPSVTPVGFSSQVMAPVVSCTSPFHQVPPFSHTCALTL